MHSTFNPFECVRCCKGRFSIQCDRRAGGITLYNEISLNSRRSGWSGSNNWRSGSNRGGSNSWRGGNDGFARSDDNVCKGAKQADRSEGQPKPSRHLLSFADGSIRLTLGLWLPILNGHPSLDLAGILRGLSDDGTVFDLAQSRLIKKAVIDRCADFRSLNRTGAFDGFLRSIVKIVFDRGNVLWRGREKGTSFAARGGDVGYRLQAIDE